MVSYEKLLYVSVSRNWLSDTVKVILFHVSENIFEYTFMAAIANVRLGKIMIS